MDPQTSEPTPAAPQPAPAPETPTPAPAATPAAEAILPPVPDTWPGAFGVYKYSKQAVKPNAATVVFVWLIFAVIQGLIDYKTDNFGSTISIIFTALGDVALVLVFLASVKGEKISVGNALSQALPFWLKNIGLSLLVGLAAVLSFIALVVPFFIVFPRLVLVTYFLVDRKLGVIEAFKASWHETKGHSTKVWGVIGATILMALLMVTIIGIPFSIYFLIMYSAANAVLYEFIKKNPAQATAPAQPVAPAPAPPATA
jgi:hypothetical protein